MTEDEIKQTTPLVVAGAVAAAGAKGDNPFAWRNRVFQNIGEVGALMRNGSEADALASRVLASDVFRAIYIGYEEEHGKTDGKPSDKPTRIIIKTQSDSAIKNNPGKDDHNPEGFEYTRSEPLWTIAGRHTRTRLDALDAGTPILVYKYTEQIGQNKKVRVLVHFDVLGRPVQSDANDRRSTATPASSPGVTGQAPVEGGNPPSPAPPEPHSQDDNKALTEISTRFDKLTAKQRLTFGRSCRAAEIGDFMCPDPANMPQVLELLTAAEAV